MVELKYKSLSQNDQSVVKVWILAFLYKSTPSFVEIFLGLKGQLIQFMVDHLSKTIIRLINHFFFIFFF